MALRFTGMIFFFKLEVISLSISQTEIQERLEATSDPTENREKTFSKEKPPGNEQHSSSPDFTRPHRAPTKLPEKPSQSKGILKIQGASVIWKGQ